MMIPAEVSAAIRAAVRAARARNDAAVVRRAVVDAVCGVTPPCQDAHDGACAEEGYQMARFEAGYAHP
jgi:hypothetical protein